ncbi:hypothetical protein PDESU_00919 [Pontiella desulfatans]|uniref:N-acetyltransferase domain-containing protein n=1 Tax=Pontiella desulfatans TaxID=2750659 RepID=A0A6C2TXQ0_PONDE|nr:GNAT family N-acetyltransferase [Pontiella desulfatans]VGO12367.1 hypothetical protein PDESU_00919 [Pontiella desulfatans]
MGSYTIRSAQPEDRDALATLIRDSTNAYYQNKFGTGIFPPTEMHTRDFVDLYNQLDGSEALLCVDEDGAIGGSCFMHRRETHFSLGIMNVSSDHFGQGIARQLLTEIIFQAEAAGLPLRLVSSCMNLDSYSLYTRAGLKPFEFYQDLLVDVPEAGLPNADGGIAVRSGTLADVEAIAKLELEISGISRRTDYTHFITNPDGLWHLSVAEEDGNITGYLASGSSQACNMIGPGASRTEEAAIALIDAELDRHRGRTPVLLLPGRFNRAVQHVYGLGGRNCETHVAQCLGEAFRPNGITMPTFLPESG